jgi:hypothetical protein
MSQDDAGGPFHETAEDLARALGVDPSWVSRNRRKRWFPGRTSKGFDEAAVRAAAEKNVKGWLRSSASKRPEGESPLVSLALSPVPENRALAARLLAAIRVVAIAKTGDELRDLVSSGEEERIEKLMKGWLVEDAFVGQSWEAKARGLDAFLHPPRPAVPMESVRA